MVQKDFAPSESDHMGVKDVKCFISIYLLTYLPIYLVSLEDKNIGLQSEDKGGAAFFRCTSDSITPEPCGQVHLRPEVTLQPQIPQTAKIKQNKKKIIAP